MVDRIRSIELGLPRLQRPLDRMNFAQVYCAGDATGRNWHVSAGVVMTDRTVDTIGNGGAEVPEHGAYPLVFRSLNKR